MNRRAEAPATEPEGFSRRRENAKPLIPAKTADQYGRSKIGGAFLEVHEPQQGPSTQEDGITKRDLIQTITTTVAGSCFIPHLRDRPACRSSAIPTVSIMRFFFPEGTLKTK